jgi:hypothetical protein
MRSKPTWFQVARRPKWIGGLLIALLVAAICGLLGQWQIERSFSEFVASNQTALPTQVATPGSTAAPNPSAAGKVVSIVFKIDRANVYIVKDRRQIDGRDGYWVIANSTNPVGKSVTVVLGFAADLASAEKARLAIMSAPAEADFTSGNGVLAQGEPPLAADDAKSYLLGSVAPAQLLNLFAPDAAIDAEPGFVILLDSEVATGLEQVTLGAPRGGNELNWLNIFYGAEWALFAGFAVFMWWRLVADARVREEAEAKLEA